MKQLSNLSVAKRLALGFALVLLLSVGVITLSISRLNALAEALEAQGFKADGKAGLAAADAKLG